MAWDDYGALGTTAIAIYVFTGSRDESEEYYGAAHFLEHAVFKGAQRWSALDIANIQDRLGGEINAFTTRDYTVFYAKVLASKAEAALELLWAMVSEPWLNPDDIAKERQVIMEELLEAEDDLEDRSSELYMEALFAHPHFYHDVLGTRESLREMTPERIRRFHQRFYHPENMAVILSGTRVPELIKRAEQLRFPMAFTQAFARPERKPPVMTPHAEIREMPGEQVHLTLGVKAPTLFDPSHDAALLLSTILGGQNSSRLWQRLREEEGLVYSVSSTYSALADWGELSIYMALRTASAAQALAAVHNEIEKFLRSGPSEDERAWALTQAESSMVFTMETPEGRMARLGSYAVYGLSPLEPQERLEQLEQVNCQQITELARLILTNTTWAVAACGPVQGMESVLASSFPA